MNVRRLGDIELVSGFDSKTTEMIPTAQLRDGYPEAVCNRDQSIATACAIESGGYGLRCGSHGHDDCVEVAEIRSGGELIYVGDFRD